MRLASRVVKFGMAFTYPCPRKLRQIMKMSLIEREPTHTVKEIWAEFHQPKVNNICSVLDREQHHLLTKRASSAPLFLVPVFRKGGHFKLLTQWQSNCFLCTFLEDYKRQGSNAQPYLIITLFPELLFKKSIVLARGDILGNSLSKPEAEDVWRNIQRSYCQEDTFEMVHNFNNSPQSFNDQAYNSALESITDS